MNTKLFIAFFYLFVLLLNNSEGDRYRNFYAKEVHTLEHKKITEGE